MANKTKQRIDGNNNNQQFITSQTNNIIIGIDEQKAHEISTQAATEISQRYFKQCQEIANKRMDEFEEITINKLTKIENSLNSFLDPDFVTQYRLAQFKSAQTTDVNCYEILSELLIHRINKKDDYYTKTGIDGAIEIANKLSDSALSALTIFGCVLNVMPRSIDAEQGLSTLNNLYGVIIDDATLPEGNQWLDQLDILRAIRVSPYTIRKFRDLFTEKLKKYCDIGIPTNSENAAKARSLEADLGIPLLIQNPLLDGYLKLCFSKSDFENIRIPHDGDHVFLKDLEPKDQIRNAIDTIFSLYESDAESQRRINELLYEKAVSFKYIKIVQEWWDKIPHSIELTCIGRVLSHANAKKCYPEFPPLD